MKKNFFKKLSFVMALAMIISVIAPAAGAFAATGLRLNATTKTLFLGENNTYNFNALGKSKGATEKWTSSKTSVATVNAKNGVVTAKAVGTTYITATITNAKKTVTKKLKAKVVVGDNIKTLSVAAPAGADTAKLAVGTDYALSTSYVTKSGSKTKTTNTFAWSVDKEGATVSKTGVFKATAPGEYTVTVTANRYKNIKVADASIKVTVVNSIKEVKQSTTKAFTVEFTGAVKAADLTATTATVAQVLNGKDVVTGAEKIKSINLDSTGKVATVELYGDFAASTTYKFTYGDMSASFVSASKDLKYITGIVFDDFTVNTKEGDRSKNLLDSVYAVNADGVKFLSGSDISSFLSFEVTSDQTKGSVNSNTKKAFIYTAGNAITVKATYTNYLYNDTAKKYETVSYTDSAVGTGIDSSVDTATLQFAVAKTNAPTSIASAWTTGITMAAGDQGYDIFTRYRKTTEGSSDPYNYTTVGDNSVFTYVPSDPSKLSIVGTSIYPISAGNVTVVVKNADGTKVLGSFEVQIGTERVLAAATPDYPVVTVGNHATYGETKKITISTVDTLGAGMAAGQVTASISANPNGLHVNFPNGTTSSSAGKIDVTVDAKNLDKGSYQFKLLLTDVKLDGTNVTREVVIAVTVTDSRSLNTVQSYAVALEDTTDATDTAVVSADFTNLGGNTTYELVVYGINSAGFRVAKISNTMYNPVIKLNGTTVSSSSLGLNGLDAVTTSNGALILANTGVYSISAEATLALQNNTQGLSTSLPVRAQGAPLDVTSFSLTNSYQPNVSVEHYTVESSTYSSVKAAVMRAVTLTQTSGDNIQKVTLGDIVSITGINGTTSVTNITNGTVSNGNLYIDTVTANLTFGGKVKQFTFKVDKSITIK